MGLAVSVSAEFLEQAWDACSVSSGAVNHATAGTSGETREMSPVWNASAFRRSFPSAWAQYLRETYRTAYAVEKAFGIDGKTARDWISGKRDPSGSFVVAVVAADPNAMKTLGRME